MGQQKVMTLRAELARLTSAQFTMNFYGKIVDQLEDLLRKRAKEGHGSFLLDIPSKAVEDQLITWANGHWVDLPQTRPISYGICGYGVLFVWGWEPMLFNAQARITTEGILEEIA